MIPSVSDLSLPQPHQRNDRLIALFLLGAVLFMPPLLQVFGSGASVFGCPLLFVYIFTTWAILVALIAIDVERRDIPRRAAPPAGSSTPSRSITPGDGSPQPAPPG